PRRFTTGFCNRWLPQCSGKLPPPSPPTEKASARQDQAGNASTRDGPRDGYNVTKANRKAVINFGVGVGPRYRTERTQERDGAVGFSSRNGLATDGNWWRSREILARTAGLKRGCSRERENKGGGAASATKTPNRNHRIDHRRGERDRIDARGRAALKVDHSVSK